MPALFILLWSSGYIFVKLGLRDNQPLAFLSLRLAFSWLLLVPILLYQRPAFPTSWRQIKMIAMTALLLQGLYQIFFFAALHEDVPPGILTIILGAQPLITALVMRESINARQMGGLLVGLVGLTLVVSDTLMTGAITRLGVSYAFLSLGGITFGTIFQKKYCSDVPLAANLFIQYSISAVFVSTLWLLLEPSAVKWTANFAIALSWMVVVISLSATFLFYKLLKNGKATNVTSYLYCVPPVTAVMDYYLFHHALSYTTVFGMAMVMVSLVLVHRLKNRGTEN